MIDAILHAVKDGIRSAGFGYDAKTCDIRDDGKPPPACGDVFVSVHQGQQTSTMDNALDEYYDFSLTLTMRVKGVPLDKVGDKLLAVRVARKIGFNSRANLLATFMHMNWGVLGDANTILVELSPDAQLVYGFSEPARYRGMNPPILVGGEWFEAEPDAEEVGLVGEIRFAECRRGPQAIASFS